MIRLVESLPDINPDPIGLPDAVLLRPSVIAVLDGVKGEVIVVAPALGLHRAQNAKAAYAQAAERVMDAIRDLERGLPDAGRDFGTETPLSEPVSNFPKDDYKAAVEKAREYIAARRYLSGRTLAALETGLHPPALLALPRAPTHQSLALHVPLRFRRLPGHRRLA